MKSNETFLKEAFRAFIEPQGERGGRPVIGEFSVIIGGEDDGTFSVILCEPARRTYPTDDDKKQTREWADSLGIDLDHVNVLNMEWRERTLISGIEDYEVAEFLRRCIAVFIETHQGESAAESLTMSDSLREQLAALGL